MTTNTAIIPVNELLALNLLASVDPDRQEINGVRVEAKPGRLLIVATDGRRLGILKSAGKTECTFRATIPRTALKLLTLMNLEDGECVLTMEAEGGLTLCITEGFGLDAVSIATKACKEPFPDWRKILPLIPRKPCAKIMLNKDYVKCWATLGERLGYREAIVFLFGEELEPVEVVFQSNPEFRGFLMPMQDVLNKVPERPDWMKA